MKINISELKNRVGELSSRSCGSQHDKLTKAWENLISISEESKRFEDNENFMDLARDLHSSVQLAEAKFKEREEFGGDYQSIDLDQSPDQSSNIAVAKILELSIQLSVCVKSKN